MPTHRAPSGAAARSGRDSQLHRAIQRVENEYRLTDSRAKEGGSPWLLGSAGSRGASASRMYRGVYVSSARGFIVTSAGIRRDERGSRRVGAEPDAQNRASRIGAALLYAARNGAASRCETADRRAYLLVADLGACRRPKRPPGDVGTRSSLNILALTHRTTSPHASAS